MKKLLNKEIRGFASILPILVVAILIVSSFAVYRQGKESSVASENVLSETDSGGEGSGISGETEDEVENEDEENETPEPEESPEPEELPEPEESPEPEKFEEESEIEVKDGTNEVKIKVRSGKNKFEFQQEGTKISVESNFPLSVNPDTKELTVTTPAGSRVVAILPQQAVDNMLANGMVTTTTGVDLKMETDGSLSYDIDGTKNEKLLGVFDVAVPKNLVISAETGQVLTVNQSTFSRILDFLSI